MAKIATSIMIDEDVKSKAKAKAAGQKITFESYVEDALKTKNKKKEKKKL